MNKKPPQVPSFFDALVEYQIPKSDLIEMIRECTNFPDGIVEFDISNTGQLRGATIKVRRTEIKG